MQSLGLFSSTALVVGSMIGSGIFIVGADIARGTNSPALFLGAWVVTAILTFTAALSYGELAAMMPKAGGQYVYLRESLVRCGDSSTVGRSSWSFRPEPSPLLRLHSANFSASFSPPYRRPIGCGT